MRIYKKTVLIKAEIVYEKEFPDCFDADLIEWWMNEESECSSNIIKELQSLHKKDGCLCGKVKYTHIKDVTRPFLREK